MRLRGALFRDSGGPAPGDSFGTLFGLFWVPGPKGPRRPCAGEGRSLPLAHVLEVYSEFPLFRSVKFPHTLVCLWYAVPPPAHFKKQEASDGLRYHLLRNDDTIKGLRLLYVICDWVLLNLWFACWSPLTKMTAIMKTTKTTQTTTNKELSAGLAEITETTETTGIQANHGPRG